MTEYYSARTSRSLSEFARANTLPPENIPLTPAEGGRSILESALQIGDIIVSTTSSPVSALIRLVSSSQVSHAGLYVGNGQIIEAINGVELRSLENALADDEYAVAFTAPGLSDEQRHKIRDFAAGQLGQGYDFVAIAKHGAYRLSSPICSMFSGVNRIACDEARYLIAFGGDDTDRWFCSELIFAAYEHAGASLGTPAHVGTPGTLLTLGDRLAYVGHLKTPENALSSSQSLAATRSYRQRQPSSGFSQGQTWHRRRSAESLSNEAPEVDVKLRMFIPSPVIAMSAPVVGVIKAFGGDGRNFTYSEGTHRGMIHCKVGVGVGSTAPRVTIIRKEWGESTEYDTNDVIDVAGKPDWYKDKRSGAVATSRETLAANDDNLSVELGGTSTFHNVHAFTSESTIIQLHAAGGIPLIPGSPDIDAHLNIYLRMEGTELKCLVLGEHDGFPAYELYVNQQRVHHYDPVAAGASPNALFGSGDIDVDTGWLSIGTVAASQGMVKPMNRRVARALFKLNIHRDITERAAQQAGMKATVALLFGSNWPDVPVDGSPWGLLLPGRNVIESVNNIRASHYGEKQFWHSMAPESNMTNGQVLDRIIEQARQWWAENDDFHVGAILHMVQDSYSMSHVVRRRNGKVAGFQNFSEQDLDLHGEADLNQVSANEAVPASKRVLELYRNGRPFSDLETYLRGTVYAFDGNAGSNSIIGTLDSYRAQSLGGLPVKSTGLVDTLRGVINAVMGQLRAQGVDEQEAQAFINMLQNPTPASVAAMLPGDSRTFSDDGISISLPGGQVLDGWKRDVFLTLMKTAINSSGAGSFLSLVFPEALLSLCDRLNITIGIGPALAGGIGGGGSIGVGILFAPGNRIGFYGSGAGIVGYIDSISASIQLTVVHGGPDVFGGNAYAVGGTVDLSEGPGIGVHALFASQGGNLIGVTGELSISLGVPAISAIEVFAQYQHTVTTLAQRNVQALPLTAMTPSAQAQAIGALGANTPHANSMNPVAVVNAVALGVNTIIAVTGNSSDFSWDIQSLDGSYHPYHNTFTRDEQIRYGREPYTTYNYSNQHGLEIGFLITDTISAKIPIDFEANGNYIQNVFVHEPTNKNDAAGWGLHISSRVRRNSNIHTKGSRTRVARTDVIITWHFSSFLGSTATCETTIRLYATGHVERRTVWDDNELQRILNAAKDRTSSEPRITQSLSEREFTDEEIGLYAIKSREPNQMDTGWIEVMADAVGSTMVPQLPDAPPALVANLADYRRRGAHTLTNGPGNGQGYGAGDDGGPANGQGVKHGAIGGLPILPSGNYQQIGGLPILPSSHHRGNAQAVLAQPRPNVPPQINSQHQLRSGLERQPQPQSPPRPNTVTSLPIPQNAGSDPSAASAVLRLTRAAEANALMREVFNQPRSHEDPANFPVNLPEAGSGVDEFTVNIPEGFRLAHVDLEFSDLSPFAKAEIPARPPRGSSGTQRVRVHWSHPPYGKVNYRLRVWASTDGRSEPVVVDHDESGFEIRSKLLVAQDVPVNVRVVGEKAAMLHNAIQAQQRQTPAQSQAVVTTAVVIVLIIAAVVVVGMIVFYALLTYAMDNGYDVEDTSYTAAVGEGETRQEHELMFNLRKPIPGT